MTNYHISEYKKELEIIENATPEDRRKMEEEIALRPQAIGAKQRRKRFESSCSDSQMSGKSNNSSEQNEVQQQKKFKRIKSCPAAMLARNNSGSAEGVPVKATIASRKAPAQNPLTVSSSKEDAQCEERGDGKLQSKKVKGNVSLKTAEC